MSLEELLLVRTAVTKMLAMEFDEHGDKVDECLADVIDYLKLNGCDGFNSKNNKKPKNGKIS